MINTHFKTGIGIKPLAEKEHAIGLKVLMYDSLVLCVSDDIAEHHESNSEASN
jgi:hypothetical protein